MSLQTLLLFIPACFALNMAFGPNNLLSLMNGARHGANAAIAASVGRLVAFVIMIAIAALGLGALLMTSEVLFSAVKWLGATYLVWIGLKVFLTKSPAQSASPTLDSNYSLFDMAKKEFIVASGNPKAILIFTAFFPQFIEPNAYAQSFMTMGIIYLVLEAAAVAIYALIGARLGTYARNTNAFRWINRLSGSLMIAFGVLLAFARKPAT
ncbi:lysine transporter LysE [Aneurinibacillus migulanus]|uniref:LysE family translocator n=1 Tax=Aneurinibacillus migulanus TaxID=47500 RepID=UPI0005B9D913|nr:LysE family translocator [Aneurinibacillus migulanus]KIV54616.1 lysine transporter LysE [Aneurinibacillus migulanus]KPD05964.1 lysine transporter LysE [Aneurinibacillus migulanus]MCP1358542.1 LysE family translocator [Aneurinibacillus migulanus]CEH30216.1 Translocator protein, LysE family [Aneurinibacillus migulanus]